MKDKSEALKRRIDFLSFQVELKDMELSRVKSSRNFWERIADGLYEHRGGCYSSCSIGRCIIDDYEEAKEGKEGPDYQSLSNSLLEANTKALDLIDDLRIRIKALGNISEAIHKLAEESKQANSDYWSEEKIDQLDSLWRAHNEAVNE